jgi:hypothetical protein
MKIGSFSIYWDFIKIVLFGLAIFFGIGCVLSIPVCLLWNWLMPSIFGLPTINIFEAFGLSMLITLLAPRPFGFENKKTVSTDNVDEKLEEVLKNITSQFKA